MLALDLSEAEPHRVGGADLAGEQPQPVRVADADDRVGALAGTALDAHRAVVDLDPPGAAAVADQLVGHREAVAARSTPARSRRRASGRPGQGQPAGRAWPDPAGRRRRRASAAPGPCAGDRAAVRRRRTRAPIGLRPAASCASVAGIGLDRERLAVQISAHRHLGHLRSLADGLHGPGAESLELEPVAETGGQRGGRGRHRVEHEAGGELRLGVRHPAQCLCGRPFLCHAGAILPDERFVWLPASAAEQSRERANRLTPPCLP